MLWIFLALAGTTPPEPLHPDVPDTAEGALAPSAFTPVEDLPPYWERREVVYVEAQCAPDGTVWRAEIVASHAGEAIEDSLRLVVLGWRFPPPAQARAETPSFTELVAFAGDRTEAGAGDGGRRLPQDVRAALATGALRLWSEAWREIDPRFGPDDFVAWEVGRLAPATEAAETSEPGAALKVERGGARSDDPSAALGWYGHEGSFVSESRYAAVHVTTGERTYYSFTTDQDVWLAVWTSPTRFAAVGRVEILHPATEGGAPLGFLVPAVWVGDITTGTVERYLGAPAAYPNRWRLLELRSDFLRRASGISEPTR